MRLIAKSLAVATTLAVVGTGPAMAATGGGAGQVQINTGSGWSTDITSPLFQLGGAVPGWQQSRSFEVRNDTAAPTEIGLQSDNVVERENGCMHGEAAVDSTCGADQGELGHTLRFSVYLGSATAPAWSGSLYDLVTPIVLIQSLPPDSAETVRMTATVPWSTGDEIETDSVAFDLGIISQQSGPQVLGESVHRGGAGTATVSGAGFPSTSHLALTGLDLLLDVVAAFACIGAGGVLLVLARSRRRLRPLVSA